MAREASTLSLVTCYSVVLIPLGRLPTSPIPLLARGALSLHQIIPHPETPMVVPNQERKKPSKPNKSTKPNKRRARSLSVPVPDSPVALTIVHPNAAGIDVHSDMHMVCVPADRDADPVRQFGANTADLQEIVTWLKKCGVKTVALESTGVYWIPLFELLESEGFEVNLVEPGQLSRCGARPKTDVLDAQWIQRLHSYGLLRGSFRPPESVLACVPTGDSGRCRCVTPPVMSSTCRKPWSK